MQDNDGYVGVQTPSETADQFNAQSFLVRQILNGRNFCALVKIMAVDITGGLALAGSVDVQPLVNQLDGQGKAIPHGVINGVPYLRMQGGANAIVLDPEVGDIGVCVFCDRDSSLVQSARDAANPGSMRRSDMADGLYLGGMLNAIPTQFVMFTEDGIEINSPTEVKLVAPAVTITTGQFTVNGPSQFNGTIDATANVTAPDFIFGGGKSLVGHKHGGVSAGSVQTGVPA